VVAVSGMHPFQVSCAHLSMPAWPGATVSFRLHPECRCFQPSPSPVVVILAASDPTYTVGDRAFLVAGCRLWNSLPLDVTSASTLDVFRSRLKLISFPDHFLPNCFRFLVLHTVYSSCLAVFVL